MATIKLQPSVETPPAVEQKVDTAKLAAAPPVHNSERQPASWNLTPAGEAAITATNTITGRVFEGTISEFNKMLKGL